MCGQSSQRNVTTDRERGGFHMCYTDGEVLCLSPRESNPSGVHSRIGHVGSVKISALCFGTGKGLMLTENVYVWLQDCHPLLWQQRRLWLGRWRAQWRVTSGEPIRWERRSSCRSSYSGVSITQGPSRVSVWYGRQINLSAVVIVSHDQRFFRFKSLCKCKTSFNYNI